MTIDDSEDRRKLYVWERSASDPKYNSRMYRTDVNGSWMQWSEYGNRSSDFGWEIDHKVPVSRGGSDDYSNLQALNWKNNVIKSNKRTW